MLLVEEARRSFILWKRYWMEQVSVALTVFAVFFMMVLLGGAMAGGNVSNGDKASALVGMLMWQLAMGSLSLMGWSFSNEAATGTLEHIYLSPMSVGAVFISRSVADFLTNVITMVAAGGLGMLVTGIRLHLPLAPMVVILPLAVASTYGFGFMLAALTLTVKKTQALMQLLQFFFMFFCGMAVPLEHMHWSIRFFGQLLPMTAGVTAMRRITIDGASLGDVSGLILQIIVTAIVWLAAGLAVYRIADRRARLKGSIGQY